MNGNTGCALGSLTSAIVGAGPFSPDFSCWSTFSFKMESFNRLILALLYLLMICDKSLPKYREAAWFFLSWLWLYRIIGKGKGLCS